MSKKLFISQPMNGLSDEQVLQERAAVIGKAKAVFGDNAVPLETFFEDFGPDAKPLDYLARSIEFLAKADVAVFAPGWEYARGCRIERQCAEEYGIPVMEVLALLHDRIYTECYRFMELGYITRDGLRNLNYLYKTYHVMGGNGTGTELYKRACALPIHDCRKELTL